MRCVACTYDCQRLFWVRLLPPPQHRIPRLFASHRSLASLTPLSPPPPPLPPSPPATTCLAPPKLTRRPPPHPLHPPPTPPPPPPQYLTYYFQSTLQQIQRTPFFFGGGWVGRRNLPCGICRWRQSPICLSSFLCPDLRSVAGCAGLLPSLTRLLGLAPKSPLSYGLPAL